MNHAYPVSSKLTPSSMDVSGLSANHCRAPRTSSAQSSLRYLKNRMKSLSDALNASVVGAASHCHISMFLKQHDRRGSYLNITHRVNSNIQIVLIMQITIQTHCS